MAAKKKTRKKPTKSKPAKSQPAKSKRIARKKPSPRKSLAKKKLAMKKRSAPKQKVAKKTAQKKTPAKLKARVRRITGKKPATVPKKPVRAASLTLDAAEFSVEKPEARSGLLSGDLQGLSNVEGADSESVDELLEGGKA